MTANSRPYGWMDYAACRGTDVWWPSETGARLGPAQTAAAKAICATCPVTAACLAYGLQVDPDPAIYGGLTENERRSLRAPRTTCKRGHEMTVANTYHDPGGGRRCRTCRNAARRTWEDQ